jgi:hypothetical protein
MHHGRWAITGILVSLLLAATASSAANAAVERVSAGSFDSLSCSAAGCLPGPWTTGGTDSLGTVTGPICTNINIPCTSQTSGYVSPFHWARVGAGSEAGMSDDVVDTFIQQDVAVPASLASSPATLQFKLRIRPATTSSMEHLAVTIGGVELLRIEANNATYAGAYQQVSVPLAPYVGPGLKILRFEGSGHYQGPNSTSFDIDDVSLTAPDAIAVPTGRRAAALAKCKKKHGKKKKKKCRKRARLLPV